jgi:pimeloyl-ACP methyl ester carboxylesterase
MNTVTSADGTTIAFTRTGEGPAVILIGGAFNDRSTVAELATHLAPHFTVYTYDRRGRGGSGDHPDYTPRRELEDLAAVIEHAGGSAAVFGHSSGAVLALEAARAGLPVSSVIAYEPPFAPHLGSVLDRLQVLVKENRRDEAAALFLTEAGGAPAEAVAGMRAGPMWSWFTGLAHTLPYDVELGTSVALASLAGIGVPVLAIAGSESPPSLTEPARAVAEVVPGARHLVMDGHDHGVLHHPADLAPIVRDFLA